jgi:hypothetical protein
MRAAKAWVAGALAVVTAVSAALADDYVDPGNDVVNIIAAIVGSVLTIVAVYQTRNAPPSSTR